jgi:hypothetical protein
MCELKQHACIAFRGSLGLASVADNIHKARDDQSLCRAGRLLQRALADVGGRCWRCDWQLKTVLWHTTWRYILQGGSVSRQLGLLEGPPVMRVENTHQLTSSCIRAFLRAKPFKFARNALRRRDRNKRCMSRKHVAGLPSPA